MLNIYIQTGKFSGGPTVFRTRITEALQKIEGVNVVSDANQPFNVELALIRFMSKHRRPRVLRLDGCYYRRDQHLRNLPMRDAVLGAKHVIYQSEYSKNMCKKILGLDPASTVIHNGIDLDYINKIPPRSDIKPGSFVASAAWRDNKRPHSMIKGFLAADTKRDLYIIGNTKHISKHLRRKDNIHCLGEIPAEEVISVMKACDYQLHLCFIDSCPNAVVEGLACGLNVLCTNLGGTPELVQGNGYILNVDSDNYIKTQPSIVDNLNPKVVAEGIYKLMQIKERANRPDLDINNVAQQYYKVLKNVI